MDLIGTELCKPATQIHRHSPVGVQIKTKAIDVLEEILNEGVDKTTKTFAPSTFMPIYTTCYNMCTQRSPYNWSEQLYQRHGETIKNYLSSTVLPALRDKVSTEDNHNSALFEHNTWCIA